MSCPFARIPVVLPPGFLGLYTSAVEVGQVADEMLLSCLCLACIGFCRLM